MPNIQRKDRLRALETQVRQLYAEAARTLWQLGQCLTEVQRDALWLESGHSSFEAWLQDFGLVSRNTAYKAMRIAEHFSGEMAERFGPEKLDAGLRYLAATKQEEKAGDLVAVDIRVRADGGKWTSVAFADATARQINEAAVHLGQSRHARRIPADMRKRVEKLSGALPAAPKGTRQGDRVRLVRGTDGRLAVTFRSVPVDEIDAFLEAVRAALGSGDGS